MTRAAILNNRVTLVALLVVVAAGINAFTTLPRSEDPGFIIRVAQVTTHFPGASPERVEQLVSDKLEGWQDNIQNVHATRWMAIRD